MSNPIIPQAIVLQGSGIVCLANVNDPEGNPITQASVSTITCNVFDLNDTSAATSSPTVSVNDVVFDALQTDARWTEDATGFNFAAPIAGSGLPNAKRQYQIEFLITPESGNPYYLVFKVDTLPVYSV